MHARRAAAFDAPAIHSDVVTRLPADTVITARRRADLKLLRRAFNADNTTASELSAAFRVQDPDFYGAVLAGHDEAAGLGISSRPVAPSNGRRS